jgi:hypothetical protein
VIMADQGVLSKSMEIGHTIISLARIYVSARPWLLQ